MAAASHRNGDLNCRRPSNLASWNTIRPEDIPALVALRSAVNDTVLSHFYTSPLAKSRRASHGPCLAPRLETMTPSAHAASSSKAATPTKSRYPSSMVGSMGVALGGGAPTPR